MESFIATVKQIRNPGEEFANTSLKSLVSNLIRERNLLLTNGEEPCDFQHDSIFKNGRTILKAKIKKGITEGRGKVRTGDILTMDEVKTILKHENEDTPTGLLRCCLLGFHFKTGCRGGFSYRINLSDVLFKKTNKGVDFIHIHTKRREKHQPDTECKIYRSRTKKYCFFRLFQKMINLRPADAKDRLFLQPSRRKVSEWNNESWWYQRGPMGQNKIRQHLHSMGEVVGKNILPHSLRKTNISTHQRAETDGNVISKNVGHSQIEEALPYTYITESQEEELQAVTDIIDSQEKLDKSPKNEYEYKEVENPQAQKQFVHTQKKQRVLKMVEEALSGVVFTGNNSCTFTINFNM